MTHIGHNIIKLNRIDSTNNELLRRLEKEDLPEGTLILADEQTAGRGQDDHTWESEKGKNLTFSFVLYPGFLDFSRQFYLNIFVSLGIKDWMDSLIEAERVRIKWMNDIYVDDLKISGMLINNAIQGDRFKYVVIGIGVNINQEKFLSDAPNPVSVKMITGGNYQLSDCLSDLCRHLDWRFMQLINLDYKTLNHDYHQALFRINQPFRYLYKGSRVTASIKGVDELGRLRLIKENGEEMLCDQKEIGFVL